MYCRAWKPFVCCFSLRQVSAVCLLDIFQCHTPIDIWHTHLIDRSRKRTKLYQWLRSENAHLISLHVPNRLHCLQSIVLYGAHFHVNATLFFRSKCLFMAMLFFVYFTKKIRLLLHYKYAVVFLLLYIFRRRHKKTNEMTETMMLSVCTICNSTLNLTMQISTAQHICPIRYEKKIGWATIFFFAWTRIKENNQFIRKKSNYLHLDAIFKQHTSIVIKWLVFVQKIVANSRTLINNYHEIQAEKWCECMRYFFVFDAKFICWIQ